MSICTCPICTETFDSDFELESLNGEPVCDTCWLDLQKKVKTHSKKVFSDAKQDFYLGRPL
jgi:hypothetical protein